jgi:hypothetical protein
LSKIADADFKSIADLEINLTERFMNVTEIVLKSSNVIFSIEKANILPSINFLHFTFNLTFFENIKITKANYTNLNITVIVYLS